MLRPISSQDSVIEFIQAKNNTVTTPLTTPISEQNPKKFPRDFFLQAIEKACDDTGWADLASFDSYLSQLQPDFDPRLYGSKKLSDLVKANADIFQLEERSIHGSGSKVLCVRVKQVKKS